MNVSMRLTLDGLLQALRWRAHNEADRALVTRKKRERAADKRRPETRQTEEGRDEQRGG